MPSDENLKVSEVCKCDKKPETIELLLDAYIDLKASKDFWFYAYWFGLGAFFMFSILLNK